MLVTLPYDTEYGKRIETNKIKTELFKYLSTIDASELEYDYTTDSKVKLLFITGKNEDEKRLPIWDHPILVEKLRIGDAVVIDLRKYNRSIKEGEDFLKLTDVVKDVSHLEFMLLRGLLTVDFLTENYSVVNQQMKGIMSGYSFFITNLLSTLVPLTFIEQAGVQAYVSIYTSLLTTESDDINNILAITSTRLANSKNFGSLTKTTLDKMFSRENIEDLYKQYGRTPKMLEALIKLGVNDDKKDIIDINVIYNALTNMWFGPGGNEVTIMSIEHIPTWIALQVIASTDATFKRSRLTMLLDKASKAINPQEVNKYFLNYVDNKRIK